MHSLPFDPPLEKNWILRTLKKDYFKKPYDRFMWWRSYTPKNKPLSKSKPLRDRIANGDLDHAPYLFESYLTEYTMNDKYLQCITKNGEVDYSKWKQETSVDGARKKRLLDDYDKEESRRLDELRKGFMKEFGIDKETYFKEAENSSKKLLDFYDYMSRKYKP
jgi:hypothetical protein|tara:strand:+ start:355 stop:843 length:489 start_codon:yes stop_codon:yes gene_type:complete